MNVLSYFIGILQVIASILIMGKMNSVVWGIISLVVGVMIFLIVNYIIKLKKQELEAKIKQNRILLSRIEKYEDNRKEDTISSN